MRAFVRLPAVAFGMIALSSCGSSETPTERAVVPSTDQQSESARSAEPPAVGLWNGGRERALDIQVAHPNGTVLQLASIKTAATSTSIGVRIMNGRNRDVELNRLNSRQGYILLDTGERLYLSPPSGNPRLSVPAGQNFEGELVFLGRLPPVRSAMLVLNENAQTDGQHTAIPGFRIDLPVSDDAGTPQ